MLTPSRLRAMAADIEDVALRVHDKDDFNALHEVAQELLDEAALKEQQEAKLRELTQLSEEQEGGYQ